MFSYLPVPAPIPTWKLKAFWMLISAVSNPPESPGIVDSGTYFSELSDVYFIMTK